MPQRSLGRTERSTDFAHLGLSLRLRERYPFLVALDVFLPLVARGSNGGASILAESGSFARQNLARFPVRPDDASLSMRRSVNRSHFEMVSRRALSPILKGLRLVFAAFKACSICPICCSLVSLTSQYRMATYALIVDGQDEGRWILHGDAGIVAQFGFLAIDLHSQRVQQS
jgi:hypothetical protein